MRQNLNNGDYNMLMEVHKVGKFKI